MLFLPAPSLVALTALIFDLQEITPPQKKNLPPQKNPPPPKKIKLYLTETEFLLSSCDLNW